MTTDNLIIRKKIKCGKEHFEGNVFYKKRRTLIDPIDPGCTVMASATETVITSLIFCTIPRTIENVTDPSKHYCYI